MTYSIIGFDEDTGEIGSAVASCWQSVGAAVPFFRPHVGFVHTQNHSSPVLAYRCLDGAQNGLDPKSALQHALEQDSNPEKRQVLLMNMTGQSAVYSGADCAQPFEHFQSTDCVVAANTMGNEHPARIMFEHFSENRGAPLAERLINALEAGHEAGGDARGQESVSLAVYETGYPDQTHYPIDIRVDYNKESPIPRLRTLYQNFIAVERRFL